MRSDPRKILRHPLYPFAAFRRDFPMFGLTLEDAFEVFVTMWWQPDMNELGGWNSRESKERCVSDEEKTLNWAN
jgi:hypothetical protein